MKIKTNSRHYKIERLAQIHLLLKGTEEVSKREYWRTLLDTELTQELKEAEEKLTKVLTEVS